MIGQGTVKALVNTGEGLGRVNEKGNGNENDYYVDFKQGSGRVDHVVLNSKVYPLAFLKIDFRYNFWLIFRKIDIVFINPAT